MTSAAKPVVIASAAKQSPNDLIPPAKKTHFTANTAK
jgi:hypothetical protein